MQDSQRWLYLLCACVAFLALISHTKAFTLNRSDLAEPALTEAVLEELLEAIREESSPSENIVKRRFDGGYHNRYDVANTLSSKLMALKTAADWNNPGRKKRDTVFTN